MAAYRKLVSGAARGAIAGALVWPSVGSGVAAAVSIPVLFGYAPWIIFVSAPYAVVAGAVHGAWMALEREDWVWQRQFIGFGALSGLFGGLFIFVVAYARSSGTNSWHALIVLLIAALAGGAAAGAATVAVMGLSEKSAGHGPTPQPVEDSSIESSPGLKLLGPRLARLVVVIVSVGAVQWSLYGSDLVLRLPVKSLDTADVVHLPAGNAQGNGFGGCYSYEGRSAGPGGQGVSGGTAEFEQKGGALRVVFGLEDDQALTGGIDADGRFWAGHERAVYDGKTVIRKRIDGLFNSDRGFTYTIRVTLVENGKVRNRTRSDGKGVPCTTR